MIDRLYVARSDQTFGPFSAVQLQGMAASGRLRLTDTVWRHGAMEKSVFAATVKNLFPSPRGLAPGEDLGAPEACEPAFSALGPVAVVALASSPTPSDAPEKPDETSSATAADPISPSKAVPLVKAPRPPPDVVRKRRAVVLKGATILSQDGVYVHYRKKCSQCGFEDRCRSSMPIGNGMTRVSFFCPQCRKAREVQLQGIMV